MPKAPQSCQGHSHECIKGQNATVLTRCNACSAELPAEDFDKPVLANSVKYKRVAVCLPCAARGVPPRDVTPDPCAACTEKGPLKCFPQRRWAITEEVKTNSSCAQSAPRRCKRSRADYRRRKPCSALARVVNTRTPTRSANSPRKRWARNAGLAATWKGTRKSRKKTTTSASG